MCFYLCRSFFFFHFIWLFTGILHKGLMDTGAVALMFQTHQTRTKHDTVWMLCTLLRMQWATDCLGCIRWCDGKAINIIPSILFVTWLHLWNSLYSIPITWYIILPQNDLMDVHNGSLNHQFTNEISMNIELSLNNMLCTRYYAMQAVQPSLTAFKQASNHASEHQLYCLGGCVNKIILFSISTWNQYVDQEILSNNKYNIQHHLLCLYKHKYRQCYV